MPPAYPATQHRRRMLSVRAALQVDRARAAGVGWLCSLQVGRWAAVQGKPTGREDTPVSSEVVNLREAARLTGWSVKTLRRRITDPKRADHIAGASLVQLGQGQPEWVIPVESLPHRQGKDRAGTHASVDRVGNQSTQLGEGIAAMAAVITDLSGKLSEAQAEIVRLTGEAAEARGQLLQLQAGESASLLGAIRKRLGG